ncbi:MAG: hypothetical protein ACLFR0_04150 [Alphaproteobacteria bacterium]
MQDSYVNTCSFISSLTASGGLSALYNYAGAKYTSGMESLYFSMAGLPVSATIAAIGSLGVLGLLKERDFDSFSFCNGFLLSAGVLTAANFALSPSNSFERLLLNDNPPPEKILIAEM